MPAVNSVVCGSCDTSEESQLYAHSPIHYRYESASRHHTSMRRQWVDKRVPYVSVKISRDVSATCGVAIPPMVPNSAMRWSSSSSVPLGHLMVDHLSIIDNSS